MRRFVFLLMPLFFVLVLLLSSLAQEAGFVIPSATYGEKLSFWGGMLTILVTFPIYCVVAARLEQIAVEAGEE